MKTSHVGALIVTLVLVGCDRESPKGGPGSKAVTITTTKPDGTTTQQKTENRDETFAVKVPAGGTNVTQGKREEVTISLTRGDSFKQDVHLKFETPKGIKVVPPTVSIKNGDSKTNVLVEAGENAPVGRQSITITATPESGQATSVNMDIDIKKKT